MPHEAPPPRLRYNLGNFPSWNKCGGGWRVGGPVAFLGGFVGSVGSAPKTGPLTLCFVLSRHTCSARLGVVGSVASNNMFATR